MFLLKLKGDGIIKGRGCEEGRMQRSYTPKNEASSATISTEAVFLVATIAVKEKRAVATVNITGAFVKVDIDVEYILIKFE